MSEQESALNSVSNSIASLAILAPWRLGGYARISIEDHTIC